MPAAPWEREVGIESVTTRWEREGSVRACFVADELYPPKAPQSAPLPDDLPEAVRQALRSRGISELYSHQLEAYRAVRQGKHVVVATPTASGKSLCFHLPTIARLAEEPKARALYLYPTKALCRDQEASIRSFIQAAGLSNGAVVYDGDTPGDARRAARERGAVVLTNPDMLHSGILPHHAAWASTFQQLRYVVLDELHTYRGVFGSHLANVIRRLKRVCAFHGSNPIFLCATATIGNPKEHAARLLSEPEDALTLIDQSGAPTGSRRVYIYNPPVVNQELGIRGSCPKRAVRLAADLLRARVPTILFGQSRNGVEIMLKYLRDSLHGSGLPDSAVMGYRGGYLADTRRKIESGLRSGEILGVVSTNALELGIDIGELDAVVCAGYPGSVAATFQRFGRAGRRQGKSIAVLVTSSAPMDQFLASDPAFLLGAPAEQARIDPDNVEIVIQHLKCAAFEAPFEGKEAYGALDISSTHDALRYLAEHGVIHEVAGDGDTPPRFHWSSDAYPANHVPLRSIAWDNVVIIEHREQQADETLGELDWKAAQTMLHEQAIYQHDAAQYQVERFDFENHKAYIRAVEPDYYTEAMVNTKIAVLEQQAKRSLENRIRPIQIAHGEVLVTDKVVGYKKIKFHTHENVGFGEVNLPDVEMMTTSCWLSLPERLVTELEDEGLGKAAIMDALVGVARATQAVACVKLMCDPRDLSRVLDDKPTADVVASSEARPGAFAPTVHLYDSYSGGIGLSARLFEDYEWLLERAFAMVCACPCPFGCPTCVGPVAAMDPLTARKAVTRRLFGALGVA